MAVDFIWNFNWIFRSSEFGGQGAAGRIKHIPTHHRCKISVVRLNSSLRGYAGSREPFPWMQEFNQQEIIEATVGQSRAKSWTLTPSLFPSSSKQWKSVCNIAIGRCLLSGEHRPEVDVHRECWGGWGSEDCSMDDCEVSVTYRALLDALDPHKWTNLPKGLASLKLTFETVFQDFGGSGAWAASGRSGDTWAVRTETSVEGPFYWEGTERPELHQLVSLGYPYSSDWRTLWSIKVIRNWGQSKEQRRLVI